MILVTGATGILGRVIVLELLKRGRTVRATKRDSSDLEEVKQSLKYYSENAESYFNKIEWVTVDLHNKESLQNALKDVQEVYHCAAKVTYDPKKQKDVTQVNVEGTENIIECCHRFHKIKFLYVSSAAIFNKGKCEKLIDENSDLISGENNTIYAISKCNADKAVLDAFHQGLDTIIINPGMIIGSGNWQKSSGEFLQVFANRLYSFPGGTGCVDVRDVAEIAIELMEKNIFGERFIIISENRKYSDLSRLIKKTVNPFILSENILKIGRILNILSGGLIPKLRLLTKANIEFLTSFSKMSNAKIVKTLNYEFITVEDSLDFHIRNFLSKKE
ncbi:SDR family NAD(P)-dependent oxidoreductase [Chryseobacterium sp. PTM-20240506]|uniref:SDR family NAD(P)-dependent oxidoreductase n=1 Tax=unclassified Chryseobacterium TaxID=2593645 RepID=UPI002358B0E9|nr:MULTISPECIES: SDR family NAD(P)-dependent oxidoreductase [unclassified Chryseobacterium]MDC8103497.1 SDR family NAD(P)-dependent oxidoreductase [Chryseobacterium sp. B21-037]MDQ1803103.1 SDR family NAD(P)-dependent oxidoreductase [Chryseobacterium sp. CKR4-1]WBV57026.1 SDR family NAD(P)-dependent oxidoreductase [Chryseobacterium daecheongense]